MLISLLLTRFIIIRFKKKSCFCQSFCSPSFFSRNILNIFDDSRSFWNTARHRADGTSIYFFNFMVRISWSGTWSRFLIRIIFLVRVGFSFWSGRKIWKLNFSTKFSFSNIFENLDLKSAPRPDQVISGPKSGPRTGPIEISDQKSPDQSGPTVRPPLLQGKPTNSYTT